MRQTEEFDTWADGLDVNADESVLRRINRLANGNPGDHKRLSENLWELRLTYGDAVRVYYTIDENNQIVLLLGGTKKTQSADIKRAQALADGL